MEDIRRKQINPFLEDYIMCRFTICLLIAAACVSGGAFIIGKYTWNMRNDLEREAAGIPPPDMISPTVPPPISQQRKVSKLRGNPAIMKDGRLVPKDPVLRQIGENADTYSTISQVIGHVVWAAPLLAIILIVLRRMERGRLERLMARIELERINDPQLLCRDSSDVDSPRADQAAGNAETPPTPDETGPLDKPLVQPNYEI
jgi:hypothetical protein